MMHWFGRPLVAVVCLLAGSGTVNAQDKPNILVIWGDDIGISNISHNSRGMMGYRTPHIDRLPRLDD